MSVWAWWQILPALLKPPTLQWKPSHCLGLEVWFQTRETLEFGLGHLPLVAMQRTNVWQATLWASVAVITSISWLKVRQQSFSKGITFLQQILIRMIRSVQLVSHMHVRYSGC